MSFFFSGSSKAQGILSSDDKVINQQVWLDFYPHYYLNDRIEYYGDSGYRSMISGDKDWHRIYIRPSVKYHYNKTWQFQSGLGLFYIFKKETSDRFEITPWQGVQFMWPRFNILHFKHLVRFEERFSFNVDENWSSSVEFRLRYMLSGKIKLPYSWYLPFYGEFFIPIVGEVKELYRNKGRLGLGIGYNKKNKWDLSFIFNWQGSREGIEKNINISDYAFQLKYKKEWQSIFMKNQKIKEERIRDNFESLDKL